MIRALLRLGLLGLGLGLVAEVWLRRRAAGVPPPSFHSLVVIDAPIERVWSTLADIEGQPRWMREMKSVRLLTPPPVGVGTRGEASVRILGLTTTDPVEVTTFDAPNRFGVRHEGTFGGEGLFTLDAGADGTTTIVRWEERLVAPVLPHVWARVAAPVMTDIFQTDLLHLRDLVERAG